MEKLMVINIKTNNVYYIAICSSKFCIYIFLFQYAEVTENRMSSDSCISDIAVGVILDKWSRKFCFRNVTKTGIALCYAFVSMTSITMVEGQYG
ncbi:hypothetical protein T05_6646 [Trichinella murrelli]|uniref:Uncharacterized protein n=1 Tax=Trichinella murrelli TaxID=144512 RepID=A0A0V0UA30_9BILA|nr:hypothetical protein T05_6646 [Trichinella murrelli]